MMPPRPTVLFDNFIVLFINDRDLRIFLCLNYNTRILLASLIISFYACQEKKIVEEFIPNTGQIQILNACGYSGAAEDVRNFLTKKGFDIVEFGNASYWNFSETMVIARTTNMLVAKDIAKILLTDNILQIIDSSKMVDATVFVGKDYYKRIK